MVNRDKSGLTPTKEARIVTWRIFGNGESPRKHKTTSDLIAPVVRKYVCASKQDQTIAEIHGWFQSAEGQEWLKEESLEQVATLILQGICDVFPNKKNKEDANNETAFWAVSSIRPNMAATLIPLYWPPEVVDSFARYAMSTLNRLCLQDAVLDPKRLGGFGLPNAKVQTKAIPNQRKLHTFEQFINSDYWLFSGVSNVIELLLILDHANFESLFQEISHPVIQVRAARCMIGDPNPSEYLKPLQWISSNSSDDLVALAILHVLDYVNSLDSELWSSTQPRPEENVLDETGSNLLSGLVVRLTQVGPVSCTRWIVELLDFSKTYFRPHTNRGEKTARVVQLEEECIQLLANLACKSWTDELAGELLAGLSLDTLSSLSLSLAEVAWEVRKVQPQRATTISQLIMDALAQNVAEILDEKRTLFYNLSNWDQKHGIKGLGSALVLSCEEIDLTGWVLTRCQELPLSVWDAEENITRFNVADKVAQLWFLIALQAIPVLKDVGREVDPPAVRTLVKNLWTHYHFTGKVGLRHADKSGALEYAAHVLVAHGEPSNSWLMNQARDPKVELHALWELIFQFKSKGALSNKEHAQYDRMFVEEFRHIAYARFDNVRAFSLGELHKIANLWLLLDAPDKAEETASALISFPPSMRNRIDSILALRLLAFAESNHRLAAANRPAISSLYSLLWPTQSTPEEEDWDRREIDELLKRPVSRP